MGSVLDPIGSDVGFIDLGHRMINYANTLSDAVSILHNQYEALAVLAASTAVSF